MEHPLIPNIDHLRLEELQEKVGDLTKKLSIAHRMGNAQLRAQIEMALETYQNKLIEKQREFWDRGKGSGTDHSDKIDIS